MSELYNKIMYDINSSKEEQITLSSLDELEEYERHSIECKIIDLCKQGNKMYYKYIPYITTCDLQTELLVDDFYDLPSIDMSLIYRYIYDKTGDPEYLSFIQNLAINDIESFSLLISMYLEMPKSNRKKNLLRQLCIIEGYASDENPLYTELLEEKILKNQSYLVVSSSLNSRKLKQVEVVSAFLGCFTANKIESSNNKDNDMSSFNNMLVELLIKRINNQNAQEQILITDMSNSNYSLISMLPISLYLYAHNLPVKEELSIIDCFSNIGFSNNETNKLVGRILCDYTKQLLDGCNKKEAYERLRSIDYAKLFSENTIKECMKILDGNIYELTNDEIISSESKPIIKMLEVSLWSIINNDDYESSITSAIECKTGISGAITGFFAGLVYGEDAVREKMSSIGIDEENLIELFTEYKKCVNESVDRNSVPSHPILDSGFYKSNTELNTMLVPMFMENVEKKNKILR